MPTFPKYNTPRFIAVEGPIRVGKTSLAQILTGRFQALYLRDPEDNPFLGRRGVRLLLRYPDLLDTQLKALLEFSREHDVCILVPMVTLAEFHPLKA